MTRASYVTLLCTWCMKRLNKTGIACEGLQGCRLIGSEERGQVRRRDRPGGLLSYYYRDAA
jgi:hypothetical protein